MSIEFLGVSVHRASNGYLVKLSEPTDNEYIEQTYFVYSTIQDAVDCITGLLVEAEEDDL